MANQHYMTRRGFAVLIFSVLALLIIWYQRLYGTLSHPSFPPIPIATPRIPPNQLSVQPSDPTTTTTEDLSSARAPFISWPLRRLCDEQAQTALVPGLVFICDNNSGGPGNIRNYILTCIRYAIAAGATGLQVPRIRTRSETNVADLFLGGYRPFGYMFSEEHFLDGLREACPHIRVFPTGGEGRKGEEAMGLENIPGVTARAQREGALAVEHLIHQIKPKDYQYSGSRGGCDQRDPNRYTDLFGERFKSSLRDREVRNNLEPSSWENPTLVRLAWGVLWDWPVFRDGPELAATFGGLLRIREDILQLADNVVYALRKDAAPAATPISHDDDGRTALEGDKQGETGRPSGHFLGIHLRTEEDALSEWPSYENQSKGYLEEAKRRGFAGGTAYLASGSADEARRFAQDAQSQLDLHVRSKYDLLGGSSRDLEALEEMSWDQRALVDLAVLLRADYFVGVSPSSFSINVALKRHLGVEGVRARPWRIGSSDGRSWLVGAYDRYWDNWLFMFDGMWP